MPGGRLRTWPSTRMTNSERSFSAAAKAGEFRIDDALGKPVMVAQVDEQQSAVIADAMAPAGKPDVGAILGEGERAAGMGAVTMHECRSFSR